MKIDILARGAFTSALVHLQPGERFQSESSAMFRASSNIDIDVTTRPKGGAGGVLGGLKRLIAGDSFFLSTYTVDNGQAGEVGLSPTLQGEVRHVAVSRAAGWTCAGGSYLGSDAHLSLDLEFQGLKGLFSGERLFFVKVTGEGDLLVNAYGHITEVEVDGELIVDTGHVVAFESQLDYTLSKVAGSWVQSYLAGEGFVLHFKGHGKLLVQSHNPKEFGGLLGRHLPPRRS
ncbi:MAG: TIGR00266 family protein [Planctomycetota bacterium]